MSSGNKLTRQVAMFKMLICGAKHIDVALEYSTLVEEVSKVLNIISDGITQEHRRHPFSSLKEVDFNPILDTRNLLEVLQGNAEKWCTAADLYLERKRIANFVSSRSLPNSLEVRNNLILSRERMISSLQQGFCESHGIVGGDQLKIAFIINGVEVDPKTVEVRTTLN